MNKKRMLVGMFAAATLSACNGSNSGSPQTQNTAESIATLEREGKIPKLDRSNSVGGPDTNGNGIRDDIDAYILAKYPANQQPVASQLARAIQAEMLVDKTNKTAVRAASLKSSRAIHCLHEKFAGEGNRAIRIAVFNDITAISTNTKQRLQAELALSKAMDGAVLPSLEGDTCE